MVDVAGFTFVIPIDWLVGCFCPPPPQSGAEDMEMPGVHLLVRPSEICCKHKDFCLLTN